MAKAVVAGGYKYSAEQFEELEREYEMEIAGEQNKFVKEILKRQKQFFRALMEAGMPLPELVYPNEEVGTPEVEQ